MTLFGWMFLVGSLTGVLGLAGWCYWQLLSVPRQGDPKSVRRHHVDSPPT